MWDERVTELGVGLVGEGGGVRRGVKEEGVGNSEWGVRGGGV